MLRYLLLFACTFFLGNLFSQSLEVRVNWQGVPVGFVVPKFRTSYPDSANAIKEVTELVRQLHRKGYASCSLDSMQHAQDTLYIYVHVGSRWTSLNLYNGNVPEDIFRAAIGHNVKIDFASIPDVTEKLLMQFEDKGFPFAQVWLDSFEVEETVVRARVFVNTFDRFVFDTMQIESSKRLKKRFMETYLGIKTGKPYREKAIKSIDKKLSEMNYVELVEPSSVSFSTARARASIYIRDRKASNIELLIGVLPNGANQKVLITGQAKIHLVSLLGLGEEFFLEWEKLQDKTQDLDVRISIPYIFYLPLGLKGQFYLYKRDTSWIQIQGEYGVQYLFSGNNYLYAGVKQHFTFLQQADTAFVRQYRKLPTQQDVSSNEFQLKFFKHTLDYFFNPRSGWWIEASLSVGARQLKRNSAITQLYDPVTDRNFGYLYDTTQLNTLTGTIGASVARYFPIGRQFALKTSVEGKYLYSKSVTANEMFRIGGFNSLRGFDEQSLMSPYYAMVNTEFRFLFARNSYFYTFFNAAVIQSSKHFTFNQEFPIGFGAGIAAATKIGIFQLAYALGKEQYAAIDFRKSKIHFGYINLF